MPPFLFRGVEIQLSVDGAATASRFPSPVTASLIRHHCEVDTAEGRWWTDPVSGIPCLIAYAAEDLVAHDEITWNFDTSTAAGPFTISHSEARDRRRRGLGSTRCICNEPFDCCSGRYTRLADITDS